jgi:hypothetical protein
MWETLKAVFIDKWLFRRKGPPEEQTRSDSFMAER